MTLEIIDSNVKISPISEKLVFHEQLIWYLQCSSILGRMNFTLYLFVSECRLLFLTHFIVNSLPYSILTRGLLMNVNDNRAGDLNGGGTDQGIFFGIVGRNIFTEILSANTHHLLRS